ncbi:MAG TPA: tRNA lysidine(34) synthetase TilS [Calditrichae bacterium]|nr:tRNA lysidine(34) synthetase TilS [Calditrichia bacterium]
MPVPKNLKHAFYQFLKIHHLIPSGSRVLVAVSGGQDSVALLDLLVQWQQGLQVTLGVAHVHHHLRSTADADAAFVADLARRYGLPFFQKDVNVPQLVEREKISVEAAARRLREDALREIAEEHHFQWIATGHTLSDQVETLLMRMFQGTGITGLAGIRLKRPPFVRPLLFATREAVHRYVVRRKLPFREDETNRDTRYLRNLLRLEVIPMLRQTFPLFREEAIGNLALVAGDWVAFLENQIQQAWNAIIIEYSQLKITLELPRFLQYFSGIQFGIVERIISDLKGEHVYLNYQKFKQLVYWLEHTAGHPQFWFDPVIGVYRQKNTAVFFQVERLEQWRSQVNGLRISWNTPVHLGTHQLVLSRHAGSVTLPPREPQTEYIDARCVKDAVYVRFPEEGMAFYPLGARRAVPLMEFLKKAGIPSPLRPFTPVLMSGERIIAIPGLRINHECRVSHETKEVIKIELRESHDYA